jgi:hypothetical protein
MRTEWADNQATDLQKGDRPPIEESGGMPGSPPSLAAGRRPAPAGWRGWRWVAVIAGVVAVALAAALVVALIDDGSDEPRSQTTTSTAPPASSRSSTADTDAAVPAPSPTPTVAPTTSPPAEPVLEDGRHPVYLTAIDVAGGRVEFDLIQFLTGDEAIAAYGEDYPDDPGGPPNDYYIINDNPRLRRLPVTGDVKVTVLDWNGGFQPMVIAFADLPTELAAGPIPYDDRLAAMPVWLTVHDDTITAIQEQYIP